MKLFTRKRKGKPPTQSDTIACVVFSFVNAADGAIVCGATRADNGRDVYVLFERGPDTDVILAGLDYANIAVEVTPDQIIGYIPVPDLTRFRNADNLGLDQ